MCVLLGACVGIHIHSETARRLSASPSETPVFYTLWRRRGGRWVRRRSLAVLYTPPTRRPTSTGTHAHGCSRMLAMRAWHLLINLFPAREAWVLIDHSVFAVLRHHAGTFECHMHSRACTHSRGLLPPPSWHAKPSRLLSRRRSDRDGHISFSLRYAGAPSRFLPGSNPPRHGGMLDRRLRLWLSRPSSHSRPTLPPSVQANTYREV